MNSILLYPHPQSPGPIWTAPKQAQPKVLHAPGDYSVLLFDCELHPPGSHGDRFFYVVNAQGKPLGVGNTAEQACWFAKKMRSADMLVPSHFESSLCDCTFSAQVKDGKTVRTVLRNSDDGVPTVIGDGHDRASAARCAVLNLLRQRPITELSEQDFHRICTVVTVQIVSGKGVASYLKPDYDGTRYSTGSGFRGLRREVEAEAQFCAVPLEQRPDWVSDRLNQIMHSTVPTFGWHRLALAHNQQVILRTSDSASAQRCMHDSYLFLLAQASPQETADTPNPRRTAGWSSSVS